MAKGHRQKTSDKRLSYASFRVLSNRKVSMSPKWEVQVKSTVHVAYDMQEAGCIWTPDDKTGKKRPTTESQRQEVCRTMAEDWWKKVNDEGSRAENHQQEVQLCLFSSNHPQEDKQE